MKALTVRQPWAHLILAGLKDVENRSRRTHYRGRIAIHASLKPSRSWAVSNPNSIPWEAVALAERAWIENHNARHVIGTVELVDCVRDSSSPWAFAEHWHWVLARPELLEVPVLAKGKLGLWKWEAGECVSKIT